MSIRAPQGRSAACSDAESRSRTFPRPPLSANQRGSVRKIAFSAAAIERATILAERAGVAAASEFVVGGVAAVIVAYLHLPAAQRHAALQRAAERVADGGLLVIVGHDTSNLITGVSGPQDPTVLFIPDEVVTDCPRASRSRRRNTSGGR